jgi:hypothetical protein
VQEFVCVSEGGSATCLFHQRHKVSISTLFIRVHFLLDVGVPVDTDTGVVVVVAVVAAAALEVAAVHKHNRPEVPACGAAGGQTNC